MQKRELDGFSIFIGCLIGAAILGVCYGVSIDKALWLGEAGLAEVLIGAATLAGVVVGAKVASDSFWLSRSAALSTRFRDAAQLLDGGEVQARAGIALTTEVAAENPRVYGMAAVKALLAAATKADERNLTLIKLDGSGRLHLPHDVVPIPSSSGIGGDAILAASRFFSTLHPDLHDLRQELHDGRLPIGPLFLSGYHFYSAPMRNLLIQRTAIADCIFEEFDFTNTILSATFGTRVTFMNCKVDGMEIRGTDRRGNLLLPDNLYAPFFLGCSGTDTATINDMPLTAFKREGLSDMYIQLD